ncbi:N-acetylmuramoyl-L-alanine amidase family protein [Yeosuana marina]|uniref:N-acetylmuramoyl-L-alanine amidase family protein n=1 Tax=Yeosuana marina TaxID=1565536 RepID=UPI001F10754F|nr:N-acetylmuramoyl-L-alanine amidase [Yeosuana marina]
MEEKSKTLTQHPVKLWKILNVGIDLLNFVQTTINMSTLKPFYKIILTMSLCLVGLALNSQNIEGKKIVVIDPGHGGKDSGAIGLNGIMEKDIVLSIAKAMIRLNSITKSDFEIYLTRYKDTLISLSDRTRLARNLKADLFISLHCNQSENPKARGVEVYVNARGGNFLMESILLAYGLQKHMKTKLGFESRGVKFGNFQVLRDLVDFGPSVLVEFGFLSNWDEIIFLSFSTNTNSLASIILMCLI